MLVKPYVYADTLDIRQLDTTVVNYDIDRVVHFSALLSAVAEENVNRGLQVPHSASSDDTIFFNIFISMQKVIFVISLPFCQTIYIINLTSQSLS